MYAALFVWPYQGTMTAFALALVPLNAPRLLSVSLYFVELGRHPSC